MEHLNEFELEVLENLPVEPIGLSVGVLADGLLDDTSETARGKVRDALDKIVKAINGLHIRVGDDELGDSAANMYGIPRRTMPSVREFFAGREVLA